MISDLTVPFVDTALGSATVFFMKKEINSTLSKLLCGFAAGVMIAASVWSLLIPSIEMSGGCTLKFLPAVTGFLLGVAFLSALDFILRKLEKRGKNNSDSRPTKMTALAVTLHNIPEGMAVGVMIAAALASPSAQTFTAAAALSTGIAIQNFPEGAIISMPLHSQGMSKTKAFVFGALSGAVEPVFGALTILLTGVVKTALPYLLSFAAGAMIFVVCEELIPEAKSKKIPCLAAFGVSLGFSVMMALDVLFS